ncbi:MAG: RecQ family ATP-dependent DNA helicase [Solirubrobacterales bacterium]|nr:RecQ family ATP-dependent DNA helicase [Solirubrobacterales bacterium]
MEVRARQLAVGRRRAAREALRRVFGFEDFRPGQEEAVSAALRDRDALVVMPTGSGKSLCYQLPALMRDDLTVVVSPLVALMHDQVRALRELAPGVVEVVNSQRGGGANAEAVARAVHGDVRLLYVAPERFGSVGFASRIRDARVGLFVVDEAHCVSQWGHDFRPDYLCLAAAARALGARAVMGLTATATPRVAADIVLALGLRDPARVTTGFDRPNLTFSVVRCGGWLDKRRRVAAALGCVDALPAIVYTGTRAAAEELSFRLARALGLGVGDGVVCYHAGLDPGARARAQERFMSGKARVMVATNAFGLGIDKPDVRTVCHASVPASLEAYYQEAGRAGRDGRPARCLLFAEPRDKGLHVFFIQRSRVSDAALEGVAERLKWAGLDGRYHVPVADLAAGVGFDGSHRGGARTESSSEDDVVRAIIGHLAAARVLEPEPAPADRVAGRVVGGWDRRALALCREAARDAERERWRGYRAVWEYVEGSRCRREVLLAHFGDRAASKPAVACCDVCAPAGSPAEREPGLCSDGSGPRAPRLRAA